MMADKYFVTFDLSGVLSSRLIEGVNTIPKRAVSINSDLWVRVTQETDGVWTLQEDGSITKEPFPVTSIDYATLIAERRYLQEIAGIAFNGMTIATDDRSKTLITGSALKANRNPDYVLRWKTPGGFVDLPASQVLVVADAVSDHVQSCFNRESDLLDALAAGTFTESMLNEGWPT